MAKKHKKQSPPLPNPGVLSADGLAYVFNTDNSVSRLGCPVCGFDYNHLKAVRQYAGEDDYKAANVLDSGVRGDVTVLAFSAECGCNWRLVFAEHKGNIKVYTTVVRSCADLQTDEMPDDEEDL